MFEGGQKRAVQRAPGEEVNEKEDSGLRDAVGVDDHGGPVRPGEEPLANQTQRLARDHDRGDPKTRAQEPGHVGRAGNLVLAAACAGIHPPGS